MTRRQILLALLPPLFFGTGFTIAKPAVTHFPPLFMMLMVYAGIAVVLGLTHRDRLKTPVLSIIAIAAFALFAFGLVFIVLRLVLGILAIILIIGRILPRPRRNP